MFLSEAVSPISIIFDIKSCLDNSILPHIVPIQPQPFLNLNSNTEPAMHLIGTKHKT
jgi:hypothetical protein